MMAKTLAPAVQNETPHADTAEPTSTREGTNPVSTGSLSLTVLDSIEDLKTFSASLGSPRHTLPYHEAAWLGVWADTLADTEFLRPVLIAGHLGDRPAFCLPLALVESGGVKWLQFMGQSRANQATGIWARDLLKKVKPAELCRELTALARNAGADVIELSNMPDVIAGHANPLAIGRTVDSPSPVFAGELSDDFESLFRARMKKDTRKKLLKKQRSLEGCGGFAIVRARTNDEIERGLSAFLAQRQLRAEETGIPNVFTDDRNRQFLHRLLRVGTEGPELGLSLWWLECAGSIRATYLCSRYGDTLVGYANSIAQDEMMVHSPGVVLLKEIVAFGCADPSIKRIDLGLGDERYKHSWTEPVKLRDHLLPITAKGHVSCLLQTARQRLKGHVRSSATLWPLVKKLRKLMARAKN